MFTGARSDYGLLARLMRRIADDPACELRVIVGGMHLVAELGETWREVEADGFEIAARVDFGLEGGDAPLDRARALGRGTAAMAEALDRLRPDALVLLGDRFEALAAASAALMLRVPVAHIHGGEISEGAVDDAIRHAITKMASLHFTAAAPYRARVLQLGAPPEAVFNVGAPGLDALLEEEDGPGLEALAGWLGFPLRQPYILATYHPATAAEEPPGPTARAMLEATEALPDHQLLLTYPNADAGGRAIIAEIEAWVARYPGRAVAVPSLGFARYRTALRHAAAMLGNSSSGLIEAPALHVPTVNIGARQKGRLAATSVRHCGPTAPEIAAALRWAVSPEGRQAARDTINPYGSGRAAETILEVLATAPLPASRPFHDLPRPEDLP